MKGLRHDVRGAYDIISYLALTSSLSPHSTPAPHSAHTLLVRAFIASTSLRSLAACDRLRSLVGVVRAGRGLLLEGALLLVDEVLLQPYASFSYPIAISSYMIEERKEASAW